MLFTRMLPDRVLPAFSAGCLRQVYGWRNDEGGAAGIPPRPPPSKTRGQRAACLDTRLRRSSTTDSTALARRVVLDDELHVARDGHLGALRATREGRLELVERDLEVARNLGEHVDVTAGRGDLEGLGASERCLTPMVWPGFTRNEGGRSTILPSTRM